MKAIQTLRFVDLHWLGRPDEYAWWPVASLDLMAHQHQQHLLAHPGTAGMKLLAGPANPIARAQLHSKGVQETLSALVAAGDVTADHAAILKLASLHPLVWGRSGDASKHEKYPVPEYTRLFQYNADLANMRGFFRPWTRKHTHVLPFLDGTDAPQFWNIRPYKNLLDLLVGLEEQVVDIQARWQVVKLTYTADPTESWEVLRAYAGSPLMDAARQAEEAAVMAQNEAERALYESKREQDLLEADLKKRHPRYGEWNTLTRAQKEELIWAKPMTTLAQEFGISDVGIRKQCRKAGIPIPPHGHWIKKDFRNQERRH